MIEYLTVPECWDYRLFLDKGGNNNFSMYLDESKMQWFSLEEFLSLSQEKKSQISYLCLKDYDRSILDLSGFVNLTALDFQGTPIEEIKNVSDCTKLYAFLGENSKIQNLDQFVDLPNIYWFDCPHANIQTIKDFPEDRSRIWEIDLRWNPIVKPFCLPPRGNMLPVGIKWYDDVKAISDYLIRVEQYKQFTEQEIAESIQGGNDPKTALQ